MATTYVKNIVIWRYEIASDETSTESSSEIQNSATEISTDSEFAHDDPTPTREVPSIVFNDAFVTKTRGKYSSGLQKVQIKTTELQKPINRRAQSKDIELKFTPLVLTPIVRKPTPVHLQTEGYALNRTQSTGGIATKVSLELKKKYLLGETNPANTIQKSGSASTLDSKLRSFHSTISDCQKLLKPAAEISASMQTFCNKLDERSSPVSPTPFAPKIAEKPPEVPFENENEGRPRSPVHETSIIVPTIDWSRQPQKRESGSSTTSSSDSDFALEIAKSGSVKSFGGAVPKLEVLDVDAKDLPEDSLNYAVNYKSEPPKSFCGERKVLNQPKTLPALAGGDSLLNQVHAVLHNKVNKSEGRKEAGALKQKDVENERILKGFEAKNDGDNLSHKLGHDKSSQRSKTGGSNLKNDDLGKSITERSKTEANNTSNTNNDESGKSFSKTGGNIKKDESGKTISEHIKTGVNIKNEDSAKSITERSKTGADNVKNDDSGKPTALERPGELSKKEESAKSASKIEKEQSNPRIDTSANNPKTSAYTGMPRTTAGSNQRNEYSGSNNKFRITNERGKPAEQTQTPDDKPKVDNTASKLVQLSPFKAKLKQETTERGKLEDDRCSGSGRSTPSNNDPVTAVLTETELSDWAREGAVSDDLDDEFEPKMRHHKRPKTLLRGKSKSEARKAAIAEFDELGRHVCGKSRPKSEPLAECVNSVLHPDLDNIEFMDTGSESESDEIVEVKNNGYIQFHDEDDIVEDSLSPVINVVEAKNPRIKATFDEDFDDISVSKNVELSPKPAGKSNCADFNELSTVSKNTGYCIIGNENFGGQVIDLKPTDLERLREKRNQAENEEDSLLIIETGTTTEENTCSDSTVKNIAEITPNKEKPPEIPAPIENNNTFDTKRLEDKLAQVKKDMRKLQEQRKAEQTTKQIAEQNLRNNIEFEQHCQRLQSRVDFGNARDSIDIRKSKRANKGDAASPTQPKPDLIREEKEPSPMQTRREQLEKERDVNKRLVQEMVMNKMKAQNKSLERKRRCRNSFSPARPNELTKSTTVDNVLQLQLANPTPDVLLNAIPVQKSQTVAALSDFNKPAVEQPKAVPRGKYLNRVLSMHSAFLGDEKLEGKGVGSENAFSLPDIQKALVMDQFQTPKVPPRLRNDDARRGVEKLKEDARARAKLLSDEDLGLSPEDKLARLRQRVNRRGKENDGDVHVQDSIESLVMNTERRNSLLYSNDTLKKKKNGSFRRSKSGEEYLNRANATAQNDRERTKSVSDLNKQTPLTRMENDANGEDKTRCFNKSDPNLLDVDVIRREKKKPKDRERRKSITKMFTDLFSKKKDAIVVTPSNGNKGFLARISPKARDKSKEVIKEEQPQRRMSFTELRRSVPGNVSPPPIPPLPLNYTGSKSIEDSSDGESDYKRIDRSSCDTLDQSGIQDGSISSRRSGRSKKAARQSQLKRHRMAQEIQRKLEETEVKMRELELRGVRVEKALRGECDGEEPREEADLLKEWFDLMRDMTELKRYERELNVRAQELELEDRHARLQHDLKERLEIDGQKSREDIETEGSIIKEMMDIVRKRDSLIALLEEDRQRYSEEDRGFEEQMLAKGMNATPLLTSKVSEK